MILYYVRLVHLCVSAMHERLIAICWSRNGRGSETGKQGSRERVARGPSRDWASLVTSI